MTKETRRRDTETKTKWFMLNNSGKLIVAAEFDSLDAARESAKRWNRNEERPEMRVDIIQNARHAIESTRVTAVYAASPLPLFDRLGQNEVK